MLFIIPRTSLYGGSLNQGSTVLERFSNERCKTKTKAITLTNQKGTRREINQSEIQATTSN